MKRTVLVTLVLLAAALTVPALAIADDEAPALFKGKCAMCHGPDGSAQTAMGKKVNAPDLRQKETQSKADGVLTQTVAKGRNKMPAFEEKLTPEQIKTVIGFIRTLANKS